MKSIKFKNWDENGYFLGEIESAKKYTVREAMAHLEANGFEPWRPNPKRKLQRVWFKGHFRAYII